MIILMEFRLHIYRSISLALLYKYTISKANHCFSLSYEECVACYYYYTIILNVH